MCTPVSTLTPDIQFVNSSSKWHGPTCCLYSAASRFSQTFYDPGRDLNDGGRGVGNWPEYFVARVDEVRDRCSGPGVQ